MTALVAVERGRASRLREVLRVDGLAARDRALALELAVGVERRRITLDAVLVALTSRGTLPADPYVRTALRLGAYQLLYLPRIPAHAAVATAVETLRAQRPFVNALLRRLAGSLLAGAADPAQPRSQLALPPGTGGERTLRLPVDVFPDPVAEPAAHLAAVQGLPADLVERWVERFGRERARHVAEASASTPSVWLRVRGQRMDTAGLQASLAREGVATERSDDPRFLRLLGVEATSPFTTEAYRSGLFVVQDPTACAAADAVAARPGEVILDLCAAPGGKATALAEQTGPDGAVFAHDRDRARLELVRQTAERLGLQDTLRIVEDLAAAPPLCDAVLVDVPCSNTGVLARRVEARRRPIGSSLAALVPEQQALLRLGLARTRPGGRVVYSTCSLEQEENRGVVDAVVGEVAGCAVVREQLTWPEGGLCDGGYFAVVRVPGA